MSDPDPAADPPPAAGSLDGPFLLDAMLGTLATYLRMCGYDAAYALDREPEPDDDALLRTARCGACNGPLEPLPDDEPRPDHAPDDGRLWRCTACGQAFWKGSHWERVRETLARL